MGAAIGAVIAYAVGVGVSPIPIIGVILILFSTRARVNGPVFLVGWVAGLTVLAGGAYLLAGALGLGGGTGSDAGDWVRIGLGVVLLVLAVRKWRERPEPGEPPRMPRWMTGIQDLSPGRTLGLSLVLSANPKNLVLAAGAGASLAAVDPTRPQAAVAVAVFVLVGAAAVVVAVGYSLVGGAGARGRLDRGKTWLTMHNGAVMAVLFLVFAVLLISQGLTGTK